MFTRPTEFQQFYNDMMRQNKETQFEAMLQQLRLGNTTMFKSRDHGDHLGSKLHPP